MKPPTKPFKKNTDGIDLAGSPCLASWSSRLVIPSVLFSSPTNPPSVGGENKGMGTVTVNNVNWSTVRLQPCQGDVIPYSCLKYIPAAPLSLQDKRKVGIRDRTDSAGFVYGSVRSLLKKGNR